MTLVVEKGNNGDLCLRPQLASPVLVDKGGVLVVRSEPLGDLSDITRQERERRLSDSDRLLLETHYGHALTPEECASLMSISRDAFHQRVHRARVRLSELLNAGGRAQ